MASAVINIISGAQLQDSDPITVGDNENVVVRLSRFDDDCRAALVITGNGVETEHPILDKDGMITGAAASGHTAKVRVWRVAGGVEGIIEGVSA